MSRSRIPLVLTKQDMDWTSSLEETMKFEASSDNAALVDAVADSGFLEASSVMAPHMDANMSMSLTQAILNEDPGSATPGSSKDRKRKRDKEKDDDDQDPQGQVVAFL